MRSPPRVRKRAANFFPSPQGLLLYIATLFCKRVYDLNNFKFDQKK
jgi:hypothetical protein